MPKTLLAAIGLQIMLLLAAIAPAGADAMSFGLTDFQFESGVTLPELHIGYETHGALNAARDNAILLIHGTSGDLHAFDPIIGPGKTFDTDRFFIVTTDAIGGGSSSSPKDGAGQDFPRYTIRDMMRAQYALATQELHLSTLRAVGGSSMGSFVSLEWGVHHPDFVRGLILLVPSPKAQANFQLTVDLMTSVITLDPDWQGGRYDRNPTEGLRRAGMLYYPWVLSAGYLDALSPAKLAGEIEETARAYAAWDANSLVMRYAASRAHDVSAPFGGDLGKALARITAPVLILPSATDRLLGTAGAKAIRDGVPHATYAEIPSERGHLAARSVPGTPESAFIDQKIREFLAK